MGDLLLVRHGETEWSRSGQHTSRTDLPLTRAGEEQAKSLAPLLSGRTFALALTSPLRRAARTAELAGVSSAVPDADLHEWDYGGYEGVTTADIHRTRPDWNLWTDGAPPGADGHPGESPEQVGARADRVLSRVAAALPDGDVILVAHGHFLRVVTARRLGLPAADGRLFQLATGTVSRLSTEHGRPVVAEWNVRA
ncbi:histidine phosphatase family protein [Streptomyces sp. UG1]|uniref:histidine phosphatase family protein n=1 Tax=Streptomyces sp. UG1 TaxID=3417652 RepID=UPI003CF4117C